MPCVNQQSTIYFLNEDTAGNQNIVSFGTSQCLDREHCHGSKSNLRSSDCGHCGAKHWSIRNDGSVSEDKGKNCIYSKSSTKAAVRHCKDGFERFNIRPLGDQFYIKSVKHGDCISEGNFINCGCAPTYFITGKPRSYNIRLSISGSTNGNICLDREHCHSSTSNLRYSECSHCGAKHWSIEGNEVGEDDMKNCVFRKNNDVAHVRSCEDGYEELQYIIIPSETSEALQAKETSLANFFPTPNIDDYLTLNLENDCRGVRIFRSSQDDTAEVEVVHFLPSNQAVDVGQYHVQYMVTHIHTDIPYDVDYNSEFILERLSTDPSRITDMNIRYGGVHGPNHNNNDGLMSEFFTNTGSDTGNALPQQYFGRVASSIYKGFKHATNDWTYRDSVYREQIFLSITPPTYHQPLYWSYCHGKMQRFFWKFFL